MVRLRHVIALIGLGLLVLLSGVKPALAQGSPTDEIFRLVNQVRAEYGLPPYTFNGTLAAAAQSHANYLAANGYYSHYGADGSSPQDRAARAGYTGWAGENYVAGTRLTTGQGVTWWRNSPPHFANMVLPRHTEAGVGYAFGHDQNYYVLVVGEPSGSAPRARTPEQLADVVAFVAPIEVSGPREDGSIVHSVEAGHTFWAIAARYDVSLADIYLFNGLNEDSFLSPGDELVIRLADGQAPPPTPTPPATYKVREGESLWAIAAWNQIDFNDLLWLNGFSEETIVHPGNEIKIRLLPGEAPPPTPTPQQSHFVDTGDTLWGIALRYGLSLEQLLDFNQLSESALLQVGQELLIRAPTAVPTETPPPTFTPRMTPTTEVAALETPTRTPTRTPEAVAESVVATPDPADTAGIDWANALGMVAMIAGLGLTVLAAVAVMVLWRGS